MISNSVTHLRSYTNSAIAVIAGNSARLPTSPHRAPISSHRMTSSRSLTSLPQTQTSPHRALTSLHRAPISSHRMTSVWVFLDVSQCFKTVSWCFTSGSQVSQCFTMFNNVLWCLASRATIGNCAAADRLRDCDNAAGIGDNSTEIGDGATGIVVIAAKVIPC